MAFHSLQTEYYHQLRMGIHRKLQFRVKFVSQEAPNWIPELGCRGKKIVLDPSWFKQLPEHWHYHPKVTEVHHFWATSGIAMKWPRLIRGILMSFLGRAVARTPLSKGKCHWLQAYFRVTSGLPRVAATLSTGTTTNTTHHPDGQKPELRGDLGGSWGCAGGMQSSWAKDCELELAKVWPGLWFGVWVMPIPIISHTVVESSEP